MNFPCSPMLHGPPKNTDQMDWGPPLRKYIVDAFSDDPGKYADEIAALNKLRQDTTGTSSDATGRDLLLKYYGQLELLDLRFPFDEQNVKVSFSWYDAFSGAKTSQQSLAYEKACVLFNLGCMLSAIASHSSRADATGLKLAYQNFQGSAGLFGYINEKFLHAPSADLQRDAINILVSTMLAQAQECFWEKTVQEKQKNGVTSMVVKITSGVASMYEKVWELLNGGASQSGVEVTEKAKFDRAWFAVIQTKAKAFSALSQYCKALLSEKEEQYGEMVGRLCKAEVSSKEAYKLAQGAQSALSSRIQCVTADASTALLDFCKAINARVSEAKKQADKDNHLVYHHPVPSLDNLSPVDKIIVAQEKPVSEIHPDLQSLVGQPLFQKLIPLNIHEKASIYSEQKDQLFRRQASKVETVTVEFSSLLDSLSLPQALVAFQQPASIYSDITSVPDEVEGLIQDIKAKEIASPGVLGLTDTIKALRDKAKQDIEDAGLRLDTDQAECEKYRRQYGIQWTQPPTDDDMCEVARNLTLCRRSLEEGAARDVQIIGHYKQRVKSLVDVLAAGKGSVAREFERTYDQVSTLEREGKTKDEPLLNIMDQDVIAGSEMPMETLATQISDAISAANGRCKHLKTLLEQLRKNIHDDDISELLFLNKESTEKDIENVIFKTELEKFKGSVREIDASITKIRSSMEEVRDRWNQLQSRSESRNLGSLKQRGLSLRREKAESFRKAAGEYMSTHHKLSKGVEFYSELADRVENLKSRVDRVVDRRRHERDDLNEVLRSKTARIQQETLKSQIEKVEVQSGVDDTQERLLERLRNLSTTQASISQQVHSHASRQAHWPSQVGPIVGQSREGEISPTMHGPFSHVPTSPTAHRGYGAPPTTAPGAPAYLASTHPTQETPSVPYASARQFPLRPTAQAAQQTVGTYNTQIHQSSVRSPVSPRTGPFDSTASPMIPTLQASHYSSIPSGPSQPYSPPQTGQLHSFQTGVHNAPQFHGTQVPSGYPPYTAQSSPALQTWQSVPPEFRPSPGPYQYSRPYPPQQSQEAHGYPPMPQPSQPDPSSGGSLLD